jgi:hypothetical protein
MLLASTCTVRSLNLLDLNIEPSCQLCSAFYLREDIDKLFELNIIIS